MEKFQLKEDIAVMAYHVKTFPLGIGEAFNQIADRLDQCFERAYFGLSYMDADGRIVYKAAAEQKNEGEAEKYNYEQEIIPRGTYIAITMREWRKKTDTIKDIFEELRQNPNVEEGTSCIEWYRNDDEMICMMKSKTAISQHHP